jgi:hypothetical protein
MKKWEYLISDVIDLKAMEELGDEGWELVSVVWGPDQKPKLFFKREKIERKAPPSAGSFGKPGR